MMLMSTVATESITPEDPCRTGVYHRGVKTASGLRRTECTISRLHVRGIRDCTATRRHRSTASRAALNDQKFGRTTLAASGQQTPSWPRRRKNVIGRRPIAAFGNSDGECPCCHERRRTPAPRLAMLVRHDDADKRVWLRSNIAGGQTGQSARRGSRTEVERRQHEV
jgi:hypothetical protein